MAIVDRPLLNTDLDAVFDPRSVAIYGISERTSVRIAENMTKPGVPVLRHQPDQVRGLRRPLLSRRWPSARPCPRWS